MSASAAARGDQGPRRGPSLAVVGGGRPRVGADLRQHRVSAGLALREVGRRVGMSPSQVSRIERGLAPSVVTSASWPVIGAVVGLDVRARTYPVR